MKIQDIIQTIIEDEGRNYPNPLPSIDMSHPLFSYWTDAADAVESDLVYQYKLENNIDKLTGKTYGNAIQTMRERVGSVVNLPISSLIGTEPYLDEDHLKAVMSNTNVMSSGKTPVVYKLDNKYIVGDGNHRVVAAHLNGVKKIKALLIDLDKLTR